MNVSLSLTFAANTHSAIVTSFSQSRPTRILSWSVHSDSDATSSSKIPDGSAVGCDDGSLYFFRSSTVKGLRRRSSTGSFSKDISSSDILNLAGPLSPLRAPHLHSRRSISPSSTKSTFSPFQPSKSHVVSSVSTEKVEAPKNYVDFEDEQEKLKGMVKRRSVKGKTVVDSLLSGADKTLPDRCNESSPSPSTPVTPSVPEEREKDESKALPSISASRSSSVSLSTPSSSRTQPFVSRSNEVDPFTWTLICHTISPCKGPGRSIRAMKSLVHHGMLLCLHESGHIEAYSTEDGSCLAAAHAEGRGHFPPPTGARANSKLPQIWIWQRLHIVPSGQTHIVLLTASPFATSSAMQPLDASDNDREDEARVVAFELLISLTTYSSSTNLPLPNPFKALVAFKSTENLNAEAQDEDKGRIQLSEALDLGLVAVNGPIANMQLVRHGDVLRGLVWSDSELCLFDLANFAVHNLATVPVVGIQDVQWNEEGIITILKTDQAAVYRLTRVDADNDASSEQSSGSTQLLQPQIIHSISLYPSDALSLSPKGTVISTTIRRGRRRLYCYGADAHGDMAPHMLWKVRREDVQQEPSAPRVTYMLPIELNHIILAFSDGHISRSSLGDLIRHGVTRSPDGMSDLPLAGPVTGLYVVKSEKTGEQRIIGGSDDGAIAIWSLNKPQLLARWTIFLEPLSEVIYLASGRLKGCALCISQDGTIALVDVDGCQFLLLIPASVASLQRVCLGGDNLLLCYADSRARLWDIKTREFWRSMSAEKADEMLKQGGWSEWPVGTTSSSSSVLSGLPGMFTMPDAASTLTLDIEAFLLQVGVGTIPPGARSSEYLTNAAANIRRDNIRSILSAVLTFSLNEEIDRICRENLHIHHSNASVGVSAHDATTVFVERGQRGPWMISPEVSAARASAIVALLQALLLYEENSNDARTVTVFYTASLAQVVGPSYKAPNLAVLALQWLQAKAPELRNASRLRFEAGIVRLLDEEVVQLVENWQDSLPSLQEGPFKDSTRSAMALFICGTVAIEKYTLLQTGCLTEIAKSIALYLHDELSPHRALAIDLCSRGFPVWQQYVDAVEILRALFTLATSNRKEAISTHNVGQQARSAVLQIASSNTPLFMTTLSIDILQPKSVQHRKSVMQLVIFLIHKKPLALYSNLPRLVEAVVKSLDPNSTASREAVLDSATEILGHIVET
ncbi:hypothetical protein NM688_g7130 [Phlebia brevispora]|uniref:Uncharacterized protein n=1 Tax=Phlebia brevispora TaxID=194682 RepID=A0ACC1S8R2_9APHY|nr:hypothetical protein NM688_g7130 [Phlebia brevispora]